MSSRQVRRLEQLLKSKQANSLDGPDSDEKENSDDDDRRPSMQVNKPKKKKGKMGNVNVSEEAPLATPPPPPAQQPVHSDPVPTTTNTSLNSKAKKNGKEEKNTMVEKVQENDDVAIAESSSGKSKQQKAVRRTENKKNRQVQDEADDALLDQVLNGGVSPTLEGQAKESGKPISATVILKDALAYLLTCDSASLDPRKERIRAFGIDAVEDVGDGAHRRGGAPPPVLNALLPPRPQGIPLPKFRQSLLGTPNRYSWPPFSTLGVALQAPSATSKKQDAQQSKWSLNWEDAEFKKAQHNFERCVGAMLDVNAFLHEGFSKHPYHLPTLVQLCDTFAVTGDTSNAQLMLDLAMYTVGVMLHRLASEGSGSENKVLDLGKDEANRGLVMIVLDTLRRGVHGALRKGCPKTAFQLSRFTLSLQPSLDPTNQLVLLDYLALRSRNWEGLLTLYRIAMGHFLDSTSTTDASGATAESVFRSCLCLPSFHFNAALAKFLVENAESSTDGKTNTKVVDSQLSLLNDKIAELHEGLCSSAAEDEAKNSYAPLPNARVLLAQACLLFPHAAVELAKKLELDINTTSDKGWALLFDMSNHYHKTFGKLATVEKVENLFLERSFELWKPKEVSTFLSQAVALLGREEPLQSSSLFLSNPLKAREVRERLATHVGLKRFEQCRIEDAMGAAHRIAAIAPELLNPEPMGGEAQREAHQWEYEQLLAMGMPQTELDALERFEAVFGPLPIEVPLHERFAAYERMLEQYTQQVGAERNLIRLFLETLLPWNNLRDLALQRAMEDRGVADPVQPRRARRRAADQRLWDAAQREAEEYEDDDMSSDEEDM